MTPDPRARLGPGVWIYTGHDPITREWFPSPVTQVFDAVTGEYLGPGIDPPLMTLPESADREFV